MCSLLGQSKNVELFNRKCSSTHVVYLKEKNSKTKHRSDHFCLRLTQNSQSDLYELVDFIEKSNENLDGPEDKFGFNKTLWTPEESSRANGKKLKWLLVSTSLKSHVS